MTASTDELAAAGLSDLTAELMRHIGGELTVVQRLLVERIIETKLQLSTLSDKL